MDICILSSNELFAASLKRALKCSLEPIITKNKNLKDILQDISEQVTAEAIYISGELVFGEQYYSKHDGIELAKHIRLTELLADVSLLPIVIGVWQEPSQYIKSSADNLILFSPNCSLIRLPFFLTDLEILIRKMKKFNSTSEMRNQIKDFVVLTTTDQATSDHDHRNHLGIPKLFKELLSKELATDQLLKEYDDTLLTEVWLKKYAFLRGMQFDPGAKQDDLDKLRKTCANKRVLYIDDEYHRGWAYILYRALIGGNNIEHSLFNTEDPTITTSDGRFTCIGTFEEATKFICEESRKTNTAFNEWVEIESSLQKVKKERNQVNDRLQALKKNSTKLQQDLRGLEEDYKGYKERLKQAQEEFKQVLNGFAERMADIYTTNSSGVDVQDTKIRQEIEQLNRLGITYTSLSKACEETAMKLKKCEDNLKISLQDLSKLQAEFSTKDTTFKTKQTQHELITKELSNCFNYDLVFIDLRLERIRDKDRPIEQLSGIQILKAIKQLNPGIPVIVFTASEKALSRDLAIQLGADGYWIKGISSGDLLKNYVVDLVKDAKLLRELWIKIRQVEEKPEIHCYSLESSNKLKERSLVDKIDPERQQIIKWLKESFLLLRRTYTEYEKLILNLDVFDHIALNMGLILEIRYKENGTSSSIPGKLFDDLINSRQIPGDERIVRGARNEAAHAFVTKGHKALRVTSVDQNKVIESFKLTLNRLLLNP